MNKKEIRIDFLEKRLMLSDADYQQRNEAIVENFFREFKLDEINTIHVFLPIVKYKEFNTWLLIDRIKKEFPGIRFSIPRVNSKNQLLENFYFESNDQLKENKWGILEPHFGDATNPDDIDLVIVPLLAFDRGGHRVGYGKGYYDKLLSSCKPGTLKIGVSLFQPVEKIMDTNEQDVAIDYCVTPRSVISFH